MKGIFLHTQPSPSWVRWLHKCNLLSSVSSSKEMHTRYELESQPIPEDVAIRTIFHLHVPAVPPRGKALLGRPRIITAVHGRGHGAILFYMPTPTAADRTNTACRHFQWWCMRY